MPRVATDTFVMPRPGAIVHYRHASSDEPTHAVVTGVGDRSIDCNVIVPGAMSLLVKNAVRHIDDPERGRFVEYSDGYWDLLEDEKRTREILEGWGDLILRIEDLEAAVAALVNK